jgi:hypothetical protein
MEDLKTTPGGEAGYAVLAHILSAFYAVGDLDNRQVYVWHKRGTKNKAGEPFPAPVREVENHRRGQPRYFFSVRAVLAWYEPGVPDKYGKGWRVPDPLQIMQSLGVRGGNETAP